MRRGGSAAGRAPTAPPCIACLSRGEVKAKPLRGRCASPDPDVTEVSDGCRVGPTCYCAPSPRVAPTRLRRDASCVHECRHTSVRVWIASDGITGDGITGDGGASAGTSGRHLWLGHSVTPEAPHRPRQRQQQGPQAQPAGTAGAADTSAQTHPWRQPQQAAHQAPRSLPRDGAESQQDRRPERERTMPRQCLETTQECPQDA